MIPVVGVRGQFPCVGECRVDPLKRLMAAVLQTALDDCRGSAHRRRLRLGPAGNVPALREAVDYVASTDRSWPFSFENLCEALGLDAGHLRGQLQQVPGDMTTRFRQPTP